MEASTPAPPPPPPPPTATAAPAPDGYPVSVEAQRQEEYNRWLPLVKWLLVLPHVLVLALLGIGVFFAKIFAFFAVLFTGRYPEGVFRFVAGTLRWAFRVVSYAWLLNDRYPPFSLEPEPDYPASLEIAYPADGIANWRPLVQWILIIPYAIVAGVLRTLAAVVAFIGIFVILFTKRLPPGMFDLILIPERWTFRSYAYAGFMVDRYPPFEWEDRDQTVASQESRDT